jgi:hypothetical protein
VGRKVDRRRGSEIDGGREGGTWRERKIISAKLHLTNFRNSASSSGSLYTIKGPVINKWINMLICKKEIEYTKRTRFIRNSIKYTVILYYLICHNS